MTDSIASFKPLALAMGLMSLLPLLKKKQQNLFVFIIIITSFVSTEYIYNIEDYAINHSVVITADDTETKAAEQTDEIKVLTPYHNVLVESRNQLEKTATICRIQLIYLQKMVFPLLKYINMERGKLNWPTGMIGMFTYQYFFIFYCY